ncbi:Lipoprotein signal peptidase [hydrothermal vent metagenome]|uniref:Lipoprotein signal peptidase n=1 Tax=hydrothermal vent metagenome TaxID=652676 RepID=A0A1W1BX74_9ZZZZ
MLKGKYKFLIIFLLFLLIDQLTKSYIRLNFYLGESLNISSFFNIVLVHNLGVAFGFLNDAGGWQKYFFITISSVASIFILGWFLKEPLKNQILLWALILILVGAVGNLIDRATLGYVIDFLDFHYQNYHWPAFNIADSSIFLGMILFIFDSLSRKDN